MNDERLIYLGGSSVSKKDGPGLSATALVIGDDVILVDCGLEILNNKGCAFPDISLLGGKKIKRLVLTHSHLDHIGGVGYISEKNAFASDAKIIASPQTHEIMPIVLNDTWSQSAQCSDYHSSVNIPCEMSEDIPLGEFEILPGVQAFAGAAGHIPGALYLIIKTPLGKKILFCGDQSWHEQGTVGGSKIPDDIPDEWLPDIIAVTDLTNPDLNKLDYGLSMSRLAKVVKTMLAMKKKVVVASFANGRSQNIALGLRDAGISRVYLDGSGVKLMRIFRKHRWSPLDKEFRLDGIEFIEGNANRRELTESDEPFVVATPAGFGEGGPVRHYLEAGLERKDFFFISSSWLLPGCTMDKLFGKIEQKRKTGKPVHMRLEEEQGEKETYYEIKCSGWRAHLSAHGCLGETRGMIQKIVARRGKKLELIVLTHGNEKSKASALKFFSDFSESNIVGQVGSSVSIPHSTGNAV